MSAARTVAELAAERRRADALAAELGVAEAGPLSLKPLSSPSSSAASGSRGAVSAAGAFIIAVTLGVANAPNRNAAGGGQRFIAGDPLRAFACFGVFIFHAGNFALIASGYGRLLIPDATSRTMFGSVIGVPLASIGTTVPIFFTLSAFLIARPFARAFIDGTQPPSIVRYARRRFFRIVPLYWVVFTALLVGWGLQGASARQVVAVYGFDANWKATPFASVFGQAWTLDVEGRFYLGMVVVALALVLLRRPLRAHRWMRAALLALAAAAAWLSSLIVFRATPATSALTLSSQLYALAPGLLFAALEPVVAERVPNKRLVRWLATGAFSAGVTAILTFTFLLPRFVLLTGFGGIAGGRVYATLAVIGVVGGALVFQWSGAGCWGILNNAPLQWFGSRSYSFYLLHYVILTQLAPALHGIGGYKVELLVLTPLAFTVTGVLSEVLYRTVERPTMRFGQRAKPPRAPRAPQLEAALAEAEG